MLELGLWLRIELGLGLALGLGLLPAAVELYRQLTGSVRLWRVCMAYAQRLDDPLFWVMPISYTTLSVG